MKALEIKTECRAIVTFGPATETTGLRPGEYFQVTISPSLVSPSGEYIRFGMIPGDEIQGWQRVAAMTVCEILEEGVAVDFPAGATHDPKATVTMMAAA